MRRTHRTRIGYVDAHQLAWIEQCTLLLPVPMRDGFKARIHQHLKLNARQHVVTDKQIVAAANHALAQLMDYAV